MHRSAVSLALLVSAMAGASCAQSASESAREVYVGHVQDTDAVIAVVTQGDHLDAYVCGGETSVRTLTRWFHYDGAIPARLTLERGGTTLQLSSANGEVSGAIVTSEGRSFAWSADTQRGEAELYDTMDEGCRTGVVVWRDAPGEAPRVQGTWCSSDGRAEQVTPLRPVFELDRTAMQVHVPLRDGVRALTVTPVRPIVR